MRNENKIGIFLPDTFEIVAIDSKLKYLIQLRIIQQSVGTEIWSFTEMNEQESCRSLKIY